MAFKNRSMDFVRSICFLDFKSVLSSLSGVVPQSSGPTSHQQQRWHHRKAVFATNTLKFKLARTSWMRVTTWMSLPSSISRQHSMRTGCCKSTLLANIFCGPRFVLPVRLRYLAARVEWLIWNNETENRLERLPLMREAQSPKVLLYETPNDGLLDYDELKKRRINIFTGVGVGASSSRLTHVLEMWNAVQSSSNPDLKDKSVLAILCKIDNLKSKSSLDLVRQKLNAKKTPTAIVSLDPEQQDLLSRIRRGKRAFGILEWIFDSE